MFFKKKIIKKYKKKLEKFRNKNNFKISNLKKEFSKILNHDIKTVLLAQNNCLELFLKGSFGKISVNQKEIISQILASNKFLAEIINNTIFLTDFEEKTSNLQYENLDMINQTEFCLESVKKLAEDKKQNLILNVLKDKILLNADKNLVQKIIKNLITGSVSYGFEKSDILVSIEENEKEICFCTKNKSVYMTKEKIKGIFEDKTGQDFNQLGMKLNLKIAKKLIEAHHWDFIATSNEKENSSTFGFVVKK